MDLNMPLPLKDCPTCEGTGVMCCSECKDKLQIRISADDVRFLFLICCLFSFFNARLI
uniref:AtTam37 zinc finger domain-containing protein n=1 Tax=Rhizophora mucronata TaxID=61149 RepID=A0A2P2KZI8_RHIMU